MSRLNQYKIKKLRKKVNLYAKLIFDKVNFVPRLNSITNNFRQLKYSSND